MLKFSILFAVIAIIARSAVKLVRMTLSRDWLLWLIFVVNALIMLDIVAAQISSHVSCRTIRVKALLMAEAGPWDRAPMDFARAASYKRHRHA